jgi:uncharacterized membrane protein YuzA (DUF378 family)
MHYEERDLRVNWLDWTSLVLVIVGAINWGLVGIGNFLGVNWNLVSLLLGWAPLLESLVYVVVGLAGLYELYFAYQLRTAQQRTARTAAE